MKTTIRLISTSIGRHFLRSGFILIALAIVSFGLSPKAQAIVPPPDGGYPGANTAEGDGALNSFTPQLRGYGVDNTALGYHTLFSDTTGSRNTATGSGALANNNSDDNTAHGYQALANNTFGFWNTAIGSGALHNNTNGGGNTAIGFHALLNNIGVGIPFASGSSNTAIGWDALASNTEGFANTATGAGALRANTTGHVNTATGQGALDSNTNGNANTAIGWTALFSNTTGDSNTAIGSEALKGNTEGGHNTANGDQALRHNLTGEGNTAIGDSALINNSSGPFNTAVGYGALLNNTNGLANTALGILAGSSITTADRVICIGNAVGGANVSDSCYIGNIWDQPGGSQAVYVNSDGKLGFQVSSRRFKDEIKPVDRASEAIYALKPVSFRYKAEIEPTRPRGFGLIAEDVQKINPDLVMRDADGKPASVRYDAVNAMLLNEFLKEHKKVEEQEATITELKSAIAEQQKSFESKFAEQEKQMRALASGLQKVSVQIEINKASPRTALNNH
jgi:trimeric autotransporter adhesin